jgi:hypothetical protein
MSIEGECDGFSGKARCGNPETALEVVLASRVNLDDYYDDENIYNADGDDSPVGDVGKANRKMSRCGAPLRLPIQKPETIMSCI